MYVWHVCMLTCVCTYVWHVCTLTYRRRSNYASSLILCQNAIFQTGNFQWCVTLRKLISYCCVTWISWLHAKVDGRCCLSPLMYKAKAHRDMAETSLVVRDGNGNCNSSPTFLFSVCGHLRIPHVLKRIWTPHVVEKATTVREPGNEHDRSASNTVMQYATE